MSGAPERISRGVMRAIRYKGAVAVAAAAAALALLAIAAPGGSAAAPLAAACPAHALTSVPPNAWAPARSKLAPPGASSLRICRYGGLNAQVHLGLEGSRLLRAGSLQTHLIDELDALPPIPKGAIFSAVANCPMDDGSQILLLLDYPGAHAVTISLEETGCSRASNGDLARIANGYRNTVGPRLLAELKALTPLRS